jgi:N6-L-threonylcarbamoyladenine synthase
MIILAIDTSCDETSVAVTQGLTILSNVISSQVRFHKKFGGVVPFLAQRLHRERIDSVVELALQRAGVGVEEIEAIAVTYGPGLAPALQVGLETAEALRRKLSIPLYAINHMAGHIASCFAGKAKPELPALAILVSGGHTEWVYMKSFTEVEVVGATLDDALGEAYDKVAKMLGLGYPGGKLVSKLALEGDSSAYTLPVAMQYSKDLNISYSGLKNAVRLLIEELKGGHHQATIDRQQICDVCATFEDVAQKALLIKVEKALIAYPETKTLLLAGGVSANNELRKRLRTLAKKMGINLVVPPNLRLCTDNAAMIGLAAYLGIELGQQPVNTEKLDRVPNLSL